MQLSIINMVLLSLHVLASFNSSMKQYDLSPAYHAGSRSCGRYPAPIVKGARDVFLCLSLHARQHEFRFPTTMGSRRLL